jgi:hypothetical protein
MKEVFKIWFMVVMIVMVIGFVGFIGKVILFPAHVANTTVDTAYKITDKTLDADNVINNYEWFKQQYEDYQAIQTKIGQAEVAANSFKESAGDRSNWTFEDKNEYSRLTSIVDGLKYQAEDIKAEYNAKSKMLNRNIFKTKDLPYQIN